MEMSMQRKGTADFEEYARSHPVRAAILALHEKDERRSLAPRALASELDDISHLTTAVVAYHVLVLTQAGLLPGSHD
jgi:hypothetical protein